MKHRMRLFAVAGLAAALVSCDSTQSRNPLTGETASTSMSLAQERQIGEEENKKVQAQFGGAYGDADLQAYVQEVGDRLRRAAAEGGPTTTEEGVVTAAEIANEPFTYTLLNDQLVNAFALPGGYVYVTRGILALANDEAELAGVLGHETGHVTARHTAQRYDRAQYGGLGAAAAQLGGMLLGGYLGGETGARLGAQLGGQAGQVAATAYVQGFSRSQELEADQLGIVYLEHAGYQPQAMTTFLEALEEEDQYQQATGGAGQDVPNWLRSHPRTPQRIEAAAEAAQAAAPGATETYRDRYLAAIDGMIYGDDPTQGVVRGTTFEHPELRFRFEAPDGFQLKNTPAAVIGTDGESRIMQFTMGQAQSGDPETYLQQEWVKNQELQDLQTTEVDGREAAVGFGKVAINNREAVAMFAAVAGDANEVYRFVYAKTAQLTDADVDLFEESLRSFRRLSTSEAGGVRPLRLDIVEVGSGDTIDSLAARMEGVERPRELFVLLNGFDRGRELEAGDKVKLVVQG